jgi:hypothetical protein
MKTSSHSLPLLRTAGVLLAFLFSNGLAQEAPPSAQELAARLSANVQNGSSFVRLKMEIRHPASGAKTALQLQMKARRTKGGTDIVYQVLWPKERKGEGFLLQKSVGRAPTGKAFTPPDSLVSISAAQMKEGIFGSDLSYEDIVENFFAWEQQAIVGTETVDRVPCQILESKPGKNDRSSYAKVQSWIDPKKLVPMRVEKYLPPSQLARRIDTTRVAKDDSDRPVPASLIVRRSGQDSITEIEGSNSRNDIVYSDSDFTPEALKLLSTPSSTPK